MGKNKKYKCGECDIEFAVNHVTKEDVSFCPFCSEEVVSIEDGPPLMSSFDDVDEFDDEKYYTEDEE